MIHFIINMCKSNKNVFITLRFFMNCFQQKQKDFPTG